MQFTVRAVDRRSVLGNTIDRRTGFGDVGVEAGGKGVETGRHAARLSAPGAGIGVAQGYKTFFLQDADGFYEQLLDAHQGLTEQQSALLNARLILLLALVGWGSALGPASAGQAESAQALVDAIPKLRDRGYGEMEAFTPYPVHGLDEAIGLIKKIRESGITILIVEHIMKVIMTISDRIHAINFGETIAQGTPKEVANNRAVIEAYLGEEYAQG